MSVTFADANPSTLLGDVLAEYESITGVTLQPTDPRRLHLQAMVYAVAVALSRVNFAGNQNLLDFVSDDYIDAFAALWGATRDAAEPATCVVRFAFSTSPIGGNTVPAGKRVTDGVNTFAVIVDSTGAALTNYTDAVVECTVAGAAANGIAIGQIDTLVDPFGACTGAANTTETANGSDRETVDEFRERLRAEPDRRAVAGPYRAYEALARLADSRVHSVRALGPDDAPSLTYYDPPAAGEVLVLVSQRTLTSAGETLAAIPEPSEDLIAAVQSYLTAEERRPLGDFVTVAAPTYADFDLTVDYWISEDRSAEAADIQIAVEAAIDAWEVWQQQIGRDLNVSNLIARIVNAGGKRVTVSSPGNTTLTADACARRIYRTVTYQGLEEE